MEPKVVTIIQIFFGCDCGETFTSREAAFRCRKCVQYLGHETTKIVHVEGEGLDAPIIGETSREDWEQTQALKRQDAYWRKVGGR
jgi:hypothetical protein